MGQEKNYVSVEKLQRFKTKYDAKMNLALGNKADLDQSGKVLTSQLPSYVDDVLEYASVSDFPATGEASKIYVATDTNLTYRWSGSSYVEISKSLAIGETSSTAFAGNRGKALEERMASAELDILNIKSDSSVDVTDCALAKATGFDDGIAVPEVSQMEIIEKQGNTLAWNQHINMSGTSTTTTTNGITFVNNGNGTFTISGTATADASFSLSSITGSSRFINHKIFFPQPPTASANFFIRGTGTGIYTWGNVESGIAIPTDTFGNVSVIVKNGTTISPAVTFRPLLCDLTQLFPVSTPTSVADTRVLWVIQYATLHPSYDAGSLINSDGNELIFTGRNLFNKNTFAKGGLTNGQVSGANYVSAFSITDTGATFTTTASWCGIHGEEYIPVAPNKQYFFYTNWSSPNLIGYVDYYDKNKNRISQATLYSSKSTFVIETPANACFARVSYLGQAAGTYNVVGTTYSPYYPPEQGGEGYNQHYPYEKPTVVDTGSEVLYGVEGSRDDKTPDGIITRRRGRYTFTGNEAWSSFGSNGGYQTNALPSGSKALGISGSIVPKMISETNLPTTNRDTIYAGGSGISCNDVNVYVSDTSNLTGKTIEYELATPTTEQGTPYKPYATVRKYGMEIQEGATVPSVFSKNYDVSINDQVMTSVAVDQRQDAEIRAANAAIAGKQGALTQTSVQDGSLSKAIGFDSSGNVVKQALTKASVGLSHVDDTPDAEKHVATAVELDDSGNGVAMDGAFTMRPSAYDADVKTGFMEVDAIVGGSLGWNQKIISSGVTTSSATSYGLNFSLSEDGTLTVNGTIEGANVSNRPSFSLANLQGSVRLMEANHVYLLSKHIISNTSVTANTIKTGGLPYNGWGYEFVRTYSTTIDEFANNIVKPTSDITNQLAVTYVVDDNIGSKIRFHNGDVINESFKLNVIDLTACFGPTIADYIYSLEQATAGAGVAWFRKYFPKTYYPYTPIGGLTSVRTRGRKYVGFNIWNGVSTQNSIDNTTGLPTTSTTRCLTEFIKVVPSTVYYFMLNNPISGQQIYEIHQFDDNQNTISDIRYVNATTYSFTTSASCHYVRVLLRFTDNRTTVPNEWADKLCVNFHHDGERDGEYEDFKTDTYPVDPIELRGIAKIDAQGNLYFDGDRYESTGKVTKRFRIVDLGTLTWERILINEQFYIFQTVLTGIIYSTATKNLQCPKYTVTNVSSWVDMSDKEIGKLGSGSSSVRIRDDSYTDAATFKSAMSGVYLVYPLDTETEETASPYAKLQKVDNWGYEEMLPPTSDTRPAEIPVGLSATYGTNRSAFLDGVYRRTGGIASKIALKDGITADMVQGLDKAKVAYAVDLDDSDNRVEVESLSAFSVVADGSDVRTDVAEIKGITGVCVVRNQKVNASNISGNRTVGGFTFTNNGDGSVTLNGDVTSNDSGNRIDAKFAVGHIVLIVVPSNVTISAPYGGSNYTDYGTKIVTSNDASANYFGFYVKAGDSYSNFTFRPLLIDLTQYFGNNDVVNAIIGTTASEQVSRLIAFDSSILNDLTHDSGTMAPSTPAYIESVGVNQWDEEWEVGAIDGSNGQNAYANNRIRSKNYIRVDSSKTYYMYCKNFNVNLNGFLLYQYDINKNFISYSVPYGEFTLQPNTVYIRFAMSVNYGTTYHNDICINVSNASINGKYFKSEKHIASLPNEPIHGILTVSDGKLSVVGNERKPDGTITRRVGSYTFTGNEQYTKSGNGYYISYLGPSGAKGASSNSSVGIIACDVLIPTSQSDLYTNGATKSGIAVTTTGAFWIGEVDYDNRANLIGKTLYYELATPVVEQGTPFSNTAFVDDGGTLRFCNEDGSTCGPILSSISYGANRTGMLNSLYSRTNGDPNKIALTGDSYGKSEADATFATRELLIGTLRQLLAATQSVDFDNTEAVDLGSIEDWELRTDTWWGTVSNIKTSTWENKPKAICSKYGTSAFGATMPDNSITVHNSQSKVLVKDSSLVSYTADQFKAAMKDVILVYEKA